MKNQSLNIDTRIVWAIALINLLLNVPIVFFLIQKWEIPALLINAVLVSYFLNWVIVLSDIVGNKVYNKSFWISSMIFYPTIASLFYLARRKNLLPKGEKLHY